jgi:hypothetical protein
MGDLTSIRKVCHDFKVEVLDATRWLGADSGQGGYSESPTSMGYTFNFWSYCDIFV